MFVVKYRMDCTEHSIYEGVFLVFNPTPVLITTYH